MRKKNIKKNNFFCEAVLLSPISYFFFFFSFIKKLSGSLLSKYQNNEEKSKQGSGFVFDCDDLLCYRCHKVNLKRGDHI